MLYEAGWYRVLAVVAVSVWVSVAAVGQEEALPAEKLALTPGKIAKLRSVGCEYDHLVYAPSDYTANRKWPAIFCYHGMNGKPTLEPFRSLTGGKGFIIIGMSYAKDGGGPVVEGKTRTWAEYDKVLQNDAKVLRPLVADLVRCLPIDKDKMILGGFSRGGWMTSSVGEMTIELWSALVITGAGRERRDRDSFNPKGLVGKPIFIGVGSEENNYDNGLRGQEFYTSARAKVTLEVWQGFGHRCDTKSEKLKMFLLEHGPLKNVEQDLSAARAALKAHKIGQAYALAKGIADQSASHPACKSAAEMVKELTQQAASQLAEAKSAAEAREFAKAARLYTALARDFAGTSFGVEASAQVEALQGDPQARAAIEQARIDEQADLVEEKALLAEKQKNYRQAILLYEQYLKEFPKAGRFLAVETRLKELKSNPALLEAAKSSEGSNECRKLLSMADNYIAAGMKEKARPYLQKILDEHAESEYATHARDRLAKIGMSR